MQQRIRANLGGLWRFSIPGGIPETRMVPGSYDCVGDSIWSRTFDCTQSTDGARTYLCFEGIAYEGTVRLNGMNLGVMLPYSFYRFEVTELLKDGENELCVDLQDLNAPFGPAEGWRSFSGIVRDVFLETVPATFLSDLFFHTVLSDDLSEAACTVEFSLDGAADAMTVQAVLRREGMPAIRSAPVPARCGKVSFYAEQPALWSPEHPNLYKLSLELLQDGECVDTEECTVGIKCLEIREGHFFLNHAQLLIAGVCRHDIWTENEGHTLTDAMIEKDLRMIKAMGANFVRLVHYPHDRRVLAAADRIGLMVSEEPGLWWSDLSDARITTRALKVLEKVILRDRNHVSVAFWLAFNECPFNEQFLRDAVALARRCDPTRLISGANCNDVEQTREIFDRCGVDFYTLHPYGTHPTHCNGGSLENACRVLAGKAVFFTEWGGYYVVGNPALFRDFCMEMLRLYRNKAPEPTLAGMSYWQWQDIPEYQRGEPACRDGILNEGIVSQTREPKDNYYTFTDFLRYIQTPEIKPRGEIRITGGGSPDGHYRCAVLPQGSEKAWNAALEAARPMPAYYWKKARRMEFGPALPCEVTRLGALKTALAEGRPLVICRNMAAEIPVGGKAKALWFIGQATLGKGYPISGSRGEELGSYTVRYADGTQERFPLRNGIELATACALIGPTAFSPRGSAITPAFTISYDRNWEIYQANLLRLPVQEKTVAAVYTEISDSDCYLLLYGLTAEE